MDVRKYAEGTQEDMDPALKWLEMVGRAVATMVESKVDTRMQSDKLEKTMNTFRKGSRLVWSVRESCDFVDTLDM